MLLATQRAYCQVSSLLGSLAPEPVIQPLHSVLLMALITYSGAFAALPKMSPRILNYLIFLPFV